MSEIVDSTWLGAGHFCVLINILKLCAEMQLSFLQIDVSFSAVFITSLDVNISMVSIEQIISS